MLVSPSLTAQLSQLSHYLEDNLFIGCALSHDMTHLVSIVLVDGLQTREEIQNLLPLNLEMAAVVYLNEKFQPLAQLLAQTLGLTTLLHYQGKSNSFIVDGEKKDIIAKTDSFFGTFFLGLSFNGSMAHFGIL